jgi:hypothetical protein
MSEEYEEAVSSWYENLLSAQAKAVLRVLAG